MRFWVIDNQFQVYEAFDAFNLVDGILYVSNKSFKNYKREITGSYAYHENIQQIHLTSTFHTTDIRLNHFVKALYWQAS